MFALLKKTRKNLKVAAPPVERLLSVAGRDMPLTIRRNARATRITLRIEPGGRALKMTVPTAVAEREVSAFLDRHQGWLAAKLSRFPQQSGLKPGALLSLRGIPHRIVHTGKLRGLTEALVVDGEPVIRVSGMEEHLGRRLADFLKKEARGDLEALVARHAGAIRRPYASIAMKDTRSRWGACSFEGNLSFSWRIVMAPPLIIDYLAAHEVAHLKEMNHGPRFWALCEKLCPQMEEARAWLKRHGSLLHAVDFE